MELWASRVFHKCFHTARVGRWEGKERGKVRWERKRPELRVRDVRIEKRGQDRIQGTVGQGLDTDKLVREQRREKR